MSYSPTRALLLVRDKDLPEEKTQMDLIHHITQSASQDSVFSSLSAIIKAQSKSKKSDVIAKTMLSNLIKVLIKNSASDEEDDIKEGIVHLVKHELEKLGKKIIKTVVKEVIKKAWRIVTWVIEFAVKLTTEVILPIIEGILAFVIANPILALAGLALGGLAWWAWDKYLKPTINEPLPPGQVTETFLPGTQTQQRATQNVIGTQPIVPTTQPAYSPIKIATEKLKPQKTTFTGFGTDIDSYIREAAQMYALPEDVLRGFVKMEAGWTGAMSPTGAIGTGQFIVSTWNSLAKTPAGKAIGMVSITMGTNGTFRTAQDPRYNMRINTLATALLARLNADILVKNKLPVTGENLYMLHNIGPGIINVMLGRPVAASTIQAMEQNGMKAGMSPQDFLAYQKARFNAQYQIANATPSNNTQLADTSTTNTPLTVPAPPPKKTAVATAPSSAPSGTVAQVSGGEKTLVKGQGNTLIAVKA